MSVAFGRIVKGPLPSLTFKHVEMVTVTTLNLTFDTAEPAWELTLANSRLRANCNALEDRICMAARFLDDFDGWQRQVQI